LETQIGGLAVLTEEKSRTSLLDYYVTAAIIAVKMNIGLDYAFRRYVKPTMPHDGSVQAYRPEQAEMLEQSGVFQ
jgi:hypothetical protein